jgi:hypothetical protein
MSTAVSKNQEFIILSQEVTNATKCVVVQVFDDESFEVKLNTKERYFQGENVDLFSVSGSGILQLESVVKSVDDDIFVVEKPTRSTLIQRREYDRIEVNKNMLIYTDEGTIRATIVDISAGGMCLVANTKMYKREDYNVDINLDKNISFSCKFRPIRVNLNKDRKYVVSGKFKMIKNYDRVALIQFCMKSSSEKQIKK